MGKGGREKVRGCYILALPILAFGWGVLGSGDDAVCFAGQGALTVNQFVHAA